VGGYCRPSASSHLDDPTFEHNMSRSARSPQCCRAFPHHLARLVPFVRITAGAGLIDSHAMPGGDHHACVSRLQAFPLLLLSINPGGTNTQETCSRMDVISLRADHEGQGALSPFIIPSDFLCSLHRLFACSSLHIPWGLAHIW
jgi:hypothetical protein